MLQRIDARTLSGLRRLATSSSRFARVGSTVSPALDDGRRFMSTDRKPFEKVLVANRGEIAQRVFRTCKELDIATVAVYSAQDSNSPFVKEADEAICLGTLPTAYMEVPKVFDAIRQTGAQAVHPGYGFLSENANFAKNLAAETGAVFLGPPVNAIHSLGDKLESKEIAVAGGVTVIPGYEGPVESLEQALELCNSTVPYPILLKAASGGGGKGMRVCYNDRDVKEAWGIAKAESLKFFGDDRLLLEKFIEKPHHIEFQVMSAPSKDGDGVEVVVFPERECSIQRRNQKIIEESPSCLLKEETRRAMIDQVRQLCQTVGYQSAGTVEWLVDEEQNFYFLEMNTRLQVEHPVTEAVSGHVDLVKAMLYVGAGMGLPEEFAPYAAKSGGDVIMPYSGHAIESRIYAEDPLRGYLPSTGPLSPYVEPITAKPGNYNFTRVDSGVTNGHIVSQFYDPMLSKVVSFSPDGRAECIRVMCDALDQYVIEGVRHNAKLCQAVLRNKAFQQGATPTNFLPQHFPDGFKGVELNEEETREFAVAAAVIGLMRQEHLDLPPMTGGAVKDKSTSNIPADALIIRVGGLFSKGFSVVMSEDKTTATVQDLEGMQVVGKPIKVSVDEALKYDPLRYAATISLNGEARTLQVLPVDDSFMAGSMKLQMYGYDTNVILQTPREYELSLNLREPEKVDTSSVIMSPMPGTLISISVEPGDAVEDGQELCVIESMKMQNMIRSPKKGVISKCLVAAGSTLKVDQVILEFEKPEEEAAAA